MFPKVDFQWLKLSSKQLQIQGIIFKSIDWSILWMIWVDVYTYIYVLPLNGLGSRR